MAYQLIDKFSGAAAALLSAHTPDVGTTPWSSSATYNYTGSDFRLDGAGLVYNNAANSLTIWPGTLASNTFEVRWQIRRDTAIAGHTSGITCWAATSGSVGYRFYYNETAGGFQVAKQGVGVVGGLVVALTVGAPYACRVRCTDGASRVFLFEYSADAGQTWTTVYNYTDASPIAGSATIGLWYDVANTGSTGIRVGNLRAGPNPTTPGLTVSPTVATTSTPLTITLTGSGTGWKSGTPGVPTFTVTGGAGAALSAQTITAVDAATATLNPGTAGGTLTITDPSGGTATVAVSAMLSYDSTIKGATTGQAGTATVLGRTWDGTTEATPSTAATLGTIRELDTPGTYLCRVTYSSTMLPVGTVPIVKWTISSAIFTDTAPVPLVPPQVTLGGYGAGLDPASMLLVTPANKIATDAGNRVSANTTQFLGQAVVLDAQNYPGVNVVDMVGSPPVAQSIPTAAQIATAVLTSTTSTDFAIAGTLGKIIITQLGGTFTSNSSSVFSAPALANAPSGTGASAASIVAAMDSSSTKLANLDATMSSRMAGSAYTAPPSVATIAAAILVTPANKLATDSSGFVTLTSAEHTNIVADTRSGLTAQNYTTARAASLDDITTIKNAITNSQLTGSVVTDGTPNTATSVVVSGIAGATPATLAKGWEVEFLDPASTPPGRVKGGGPTTGAIAATGSNIRLSFNDLGFVPAVGDQVVLFVRG